MTLAATHFPSSSRDAGSLVRIAIVGRGFTGLMTAIALLIVRLIARGDDRRFQYGYWHLEPMLALLNEERLKDVIAAPALSLCYNVQGERGFTR